MYMQFIKRSLIVATLVIVVAACTTQTPVVRPHSTGKTIRTTSAPPESDTIISAPQQDPANQGVDEIEIYEGSGVFLDEEAAAARSEMVSENGEIVLNFEGESVQSVVHTILGEVTAPQAHCS